MRNIIVSEMVTVDGYFAGPKGEIDWHMVDDEFNQFAIEQLHNADTLLFGRITYELMTDYWPTDKALTDDPTVARAMNSLAKIVYSRTLSEVTWNNSTLVKEIEVDEITKMKAQSGKDILIFGSGTVVSILTKYGLIDEYRLFVSPIILGAGKPLFTIGTDRIKLKLLKTRVFDSGNVLLCYQPIKK